MTGERHGGRTFRRYDPLAVLDYVSQYQCQNCGRSPSERRIQAALDISAPSVVHNILRRLQRRELLTVTRYGRGVASDLTLTETGQAAVAQWRSKQPSGESPSA